MGRPFVLFLLLFFLLALAQAGTLPSGIVATLNLTNFTFAADFEADSFSARDYGISINDSYLEVNTTYPLTVNITNFTIDIYNFTANSTVASNPTTFTAKMRNPAIRYNLKVNGVYSQEILTDSYGNATFSYNTWGLTPARFLLTTCLESWSYTDWSTCSGSQQARTATDANACGTSYNRSAVTQACSVPAGGTSGGGGGGGSFSEGTPSSKLVAFSFQATTPILKILATVLYTLPEAQNIAISYPSSIPLSVPPTPGLAYAFMEISPTFNSSRYLTSAQIDFRVNRTWYSRNGIVQSSTTLLRFDGRSWRSLPTVQTGEDLATYSFSANTTSFSLFAIAGIRKAAAPASTTTASPAATTAPIVPTSPTGTPTTSGPAIRPPSKSPTLFLLLLLIIPAMFLYGHYSRPKPMRSGSDAKRPLTDALSKPKPLPLPSPPPPSLPPPSKPPSGVMLEGIVTSHVRRDFEVFDGTGLIAVRFPGRKPKLGTKIRAMGILKRDTKHFLANSVEEM